MSILWDCYSVADFCLSSHQAWIVICHWLSQVIAFSSDSSLPPRGLTYIAMYIFYLYFERNSEP